MSTQPVNRPAAMTSTFAVTRGMPAIRRLAIGRGISAVGTTAAWIALTLSLWEQTHSATMQTIGLVLTWGLLGPATALCGPLADRIDRRRIMIGADVASAACFAGLIGWHDPVGLLVLGGLSVWTCGPFFAAYGAAIPNIVDGPGDLDRANSMLGVGRNLGWTIGPVAGGLLFATVGAGWVFALNALSFVISAALTASVHGPFQSFDPAASIQREGGLKAGLEVIRDSAVLRRLLVGWVIVFLTFEGSNVVYAPFADGMHASRIEYGVGIASWGAGMILGSALAGRLTEQTELRGLLLGLATLAVGSVGWFASGTWTLVVVSMFVMGAGNAYSAVADSSVFMRRTPDEARGRASAVYDGATSAASFVGFLLGGFVLAHFSARAFIIIPAVGAALGALVVVGLVGARRVPTLTIQHPSQGALE